MFTWLPNDASPGSGFISDYGLLIALVVLAAVGGLILTMLFGSSRDGATVGSLDFLGDGDGGCSGD